MPVTKNKLLIFNSMFYPYRHDGIAYESYVDKEIEVLANKFDIIIVIPPKKECYKIL